MKWLKSWIHYHLCKLRKKGKQALMAKVVELEHKYVRVMDRKDAVRGAKLVVEICKIRKKLKTLERRK